MALSAEAGFEVSTHQANQMDIYARVLAETNRKFNLTALDQPEEIAALHFLDSVLVLDELSTELNDMLLQNRVLSLADLGTGAGLPGIPIKVMQPRVSLKLVDGSLKKVHFLEDVLDRMGLTDAEAVQGRAEDLAHQPEHRGQYDLVVARGLARLPTLLEYAVPWLKIGGILLAYKGPNFPVEFQESQQALPLLRSEIERVIPIHIPGHDVVRRVAVVRKLAATPRRFPRPQGLPRKQPL